MCGIIGVVGKSALKRAKEGLSVIEYRGRDAKGFYHEKNIAFGHVLHSIVSEVKQPLIDNEVLIANCEIYNWIELKKKYDIEAQNDAEVLFVLLKKKGIKALDELDGVYAFAYLKDNNIYIARDIIGVKPVWYSHQDRFCFASEKKALEKIGITDIKELNPRQILEYDIENDKLRLIQRDFFSIEKNTTSLKKIIQRLEEQLRIAVVKRIPFRKFGLLFSGGIDSTIIALMLKQMNQEFVCYTTVIDDPNLKEPEDLVFAKKIAKMLDLNLKIIKIKPSQIERQLKIIVPLIEDSNVVKVEVALTFFAACTKASSDGCKVLFSGLGSEEIFAGYQRHKNSTDINKECISGLLKLYERDLYRDDVIGMFNGIEMRLPFLDRKLVEYALGIPGKFKLNNGHEKYVLRQVGKNMGLRQEFFTRKKRAAQYGSNVSKAISKLTKKAGFRYKSDYLHTFYRTHNLRLGALVSGGKDSIYAMHTMMRQNYKVPCMITVKSDNPDSYMFHTPTIDLVELQAKSIDIPVVWGKTIGKKEEELDDLKAVIKKAKEKYKLEGIITGALYSNYQRERIEKICDSLSLKIFSPLWHINQETEVREILREGFSFIMTKVACDGLDSSWLGRVITEKDVDRLVAMKDKIGVNVAGEGGEYETLMVDGPLFSKKIKITDSEAVEDGSSATLIIKKAN